MDVSPSPFGAPADDDDDEVEVEVEVEDNGEEEDDDEDVFCGSEDDEAAAFEDDEDKGEEDEDDDDAGTVPLTRLLPAHFKAAWVEFAKCVLLASRGRAAHPVLTEKNHAVHAEQSILPVFALFFQMPSDVVRQKHALVKHLMDAIKLKRHHAGPCWKPAKPSAGVASRPGCGCLTGGRSFIKSLGALLDERQLAQLVRPPSPCSAAC